MSQFRNVGLIGRVESEIVKESVRTIAAYLLQRDLSVIAEKETSAALGDQTVQVSTRQAIGEICDLAIVVGGDGSILGAARDLSRFSVPILGVNRGTLGFLTDIAPEDAIKQIDSILAGEYQSERRFLLEAELIRDGERAGRAIALNDVVLHSGQAPRMINYELHIDGNFAYSQRADGLIVSSPTGSTAYSLSGGGPIMHPGLSALVVLPMFAHALSSRPLIVDSHSELKVMLGACPQANPTVICDGQVMIGAREGDVIYVRKQSKSVELVHPIGHNFYETCRNKLGWGAQFIGN